MAALDGEATLGYGYADVAGTPCLVARQAGSVLQSRGWSGPFLRCPRCPSVWAERA